ncbi:MAG: Hpt domain-containing protein [Nitrospirota bacterium]|jgi:HPt (histidine-containing phosphotransfer) domain-containing protein
MDKTSVLDLSEALNRVDGDQDLFFTLAGLFLQESQKEAAAIRVALGRQDGAGLVAAAHKLKSSVIEMCAPRLFERTKRLEELGRQGELAEASSVCADVEASLAEVHAALRKLIAGGFSS